MLDQISVLTPREQALKGLLQQLLRDEQLELAEGTDLEQLVIKLTEAVGDTRGTARKAAIISAWLLDQEQVEDLYIDDEDLERVIASR